MTVFVRTRDDLLRSELLVRGLAMVLAITVSGCAGIGPVTINEERTPYNEVIQNTAKQQTLLNIIRVKNGESPLFMDVTEVDAATTIEGTLAGGPAAIGAIPGLKKKSTGGSLSGMTGSVTGTAEVIDAPTIRYQPLSGQALIAQVSTPLSPESLENLITSDWSISHVLTFGVEHITAGYTDYYAAINALIDLDYYGAVIIAATESKEQAKKGNAAYVTINQQKSSDNDSLTIYFEPKQAFRAPIFCDGVTPIKNNSVEEQRAAREITEALWGRLQRIFHVQGNVISLRSKLSSVLTNDALHPPLLATRSALGMLKASTNKNEGPAIAIYDDIAYINDIIDNHDKNKCNDDFYTVDPTDVHEKKNAETAIGDERAKTASDDNVFHLISARLKTTNLEMGTLFPTKQVLSLEDMEAETRLGFFRRFMLIGRGASPPEDAFVAVKYNGLWYYILNKDEISKKTLAFVSQIDTIQAVPSQSPPLTPSISVGAK